MTPLEWAYLVLAVIGTFYGGAVTEAETNGAVTNSINYEINATKEIHGTKLIDIYIPCKDTKIQCQDCVKAKNDQ